MSITPNTLLRWAMYGVLGIAGAMMLAYIGDFAQIHVKASHGTATSDVQVDNFMVTPLKSGKAQYDYLGQIDVTCSHSLFPQLGYSPCWYVQSHKNNTQLN